MANYDFGEKQKEWSAKHGKELPVWVTPGFKVAKAKAIEIIESEKYGVTEADFWLLMNATKNEKMAYTGLIISHNGCLKINDSLESKFEPYSVSLDKDGYKGSLVYTYCNSEQGIFEVGEVSQANCKNEYPYAMAFKRLFDRVVLKLSKLAYNGIYSDSESEEFSQQLNPEEKKEPEAKAEKPKFKTYRELLIAKLQEKGIDATAYATEKGLSKETTEERYKELLEEFAFNNNK
jgi:hypothetical protein